MTELLPIQGLYAIEMPEDAYTFSIENNTLICLTGEEGFTFKTFLPPGSYEILFTTKDCSEEQAATLPMEDSGKSFGYKDYVGKQSSHFYADHALQSLLRSHNLTANNYLLIKRTNQEKK